MLWGRKAACHITSYIPRSFTVILGPLTRRWNLARVSVWLGLCETLHAILLEKQFAFLSDHLDDVVIVDFKATHDLVRASV